MTIDIVINNGKLFVANEFREGGVAIEGNQIIKIGKDPSLPKGSKTIDAHGALVLPGLIDIHVHFRDLEQKYKETMETGTRAAAAGGERGGLSVGYEGSAGGGGMGEIAGRQADESDRCAAGAKREAAAGIAVRGKR